MDDQHGLIQDLQNLVVGETRNNVTINVQDQEICAHSEIPSVPLSMLESKLIHQMKKTTGFVDVENCQPAAFREFLSFQYSGEIESMPSDNIVDLYVIAHKYNVAGLKTKCCEFMKRTLCVGSFWDVISLAITYEEAELKQSAIEFFRVEGKQILVISPAWTKFSTEFPEESIRLMIEYVNHLNK